MGRVIEKDYNSIGFLQTKVKQNPIVNHLIARVRELAYVERNEKAINELTVYEKKTDGNWGSDERKHDEHVITRAIGLWISATQMDHPSERSTIRVRNKTCNTRKIMIKFFIFISKYHAMVRN